MAKSSGGEAYVVGVVVGMVVGALLGGLIGWLLAQRHQSAAANEVGALREKVASADQARDAAHTMAEQRVRDLQETIERERAQHELALANLADRFRALADDTLKNVVQQFHDGQIQVLEQREAKLDERLTPLGDLLKQYNQKVEALELNREKSFADVNAVAAQLLLAQNAVTEETKKLNTILGRSSARGRWGEIQLQRILEIAGMTKYVDFYPQETVTSGSDARQRPDVILRLPQGAEIAIDSKVPFDAFDRASSTTNDADRESALKEYAAAMRQHVQDLSRKGYWQALKVSPSFTVCFVPSDHLLSAAYDADAGLLEYALKSQVLIAGPTTLLGLLWSTWLGWSQFEAVENIEEIRDLAVRLVDRTATLYDHANKLGKSIDQSVKNYNGMVGSLETQLLVTVRDIQRKGVRGQKEIEAAEPLGQFPRPLEANRWPLPTPEEPVTVEAVIVSEIAGPIENADISYDE